MERYPASLGSGIFRCRSGCRPGSRGGPIRKWVPIRPAVATMFHVMDDFAEFEPAMIVKAGLSRAQGQGKRLGRRPVSEDVVERIREHLATGAGILRTAKALGVGTGTVHRVKRGMAAVAS